MTIGIWRAICCAALACLYSKEYSLGVLRLFTVSTDQNLVDMLAKAGSMDQIKRSIYISLLTQRLSQSHESSKNEIIYSSFDPLSESAFNISDSLIGPHEIFAAENQNHHLEADCAFTKTSIDGFKVLQVLQQTFPNPSDIAWSSVLTCTLDFHSSFLNPPQSMGPMNHILRYSERVDKGSFLLFIPSPFGSLLLRCKPVQGGLIIWDAARYGFCLCCHASLSRIKVCSQCRVAQYCSVECQTQDWVNGTHQKKCKNMMDIQNSPRNYVDEVVESVLDEQQLHQGMNPEA